MLRRVVPFILLAGAVGACAAAPTDGGAARTVYTPGQSYFGRNNYIEYIAGNAPVIFTAGHGGSLTPSEIPDRAAAACGGAATTVTDLNTIELVRSMQRRYIARFGKYPHIVLNHLARTKLDPDRPALEAACGAANAGTALAEWHTFIDVATGAALAVSGKAWYMDMHGHGHDIQRLELGYLLSVAQLNLSDNALNANIAYQDTSSIRSISEASPLTFAALLRGASSLGSLYVTSGIPAIPSFVDSRPNSDPFFTGGENTRRHSCGAAATALGGVSAGMVCGVQVEANMIGVRDNAANRDRFGDVTALVLESFLAANWGLKLGP